MVVDGNSASEVVALWLVANEDQSTISRLIETLIKHNDTAQTQCIMADKDMTERNVLAEKIPNVVLLICLFHTLRTFCREITTDKMDINAAQRVTALEIISKLAYAKDEEDYSKYYQQLMETKLKRVIEYFDDNWHEIREQWVEGFKRESCNYLNSTNNRLESINQKIKSVVTRHSSLLTFFEDLMKCLNSLSLERDHKAAMVFEKCAVRLFPEDNCLSRYQQLLTPYAFSFVVKQFELSSKVKITESVDKDSYATTIHSNGKSIETSDCTCSCGFYVTMDLPCRHIFALRSHSELGLFEPKLCTMRWTREYYRNSHRVFSSHVGCAADINVSTLDILPTVEVLS